MQSADAVRIDSHAVATLRYIRESMDAAASVAVPGSAGLAMGSVGLLAMLICTTPGLREYWLAIWLASEADPPWATTVYSALEANTSSKPSSKSG